MEEEKKIFGAVDFVIAGLLISVSAVASVVELIAIGTVIGSPLIVITTGIDIIVYAILQFWFIMKGVRGLSLAVGAILDVAGLPAVDVISLVVTMYLANHPKAAATVTAVAGKKGVGGGKSPLGKGTPSQGRIPGGGEGAGAATLRQGREPQAAISEPQTEEQGIAVGESNASTSSGGAVQGKFGRTATGGGGQEAESAPERREEGRVAPEEVSPPPMKEVERPMTEEAVPTMQDIERERGKAA